MKTILIIGGSSGIGSACVKLFEQAGWNVFATFFSNQKTSAEGCSVTWSFLDIRNIPDDFFDAMPKIDAIVICAAKNITQNLKNLNKEDTEEIIDTNLIGQIELLKLLKEKRDEELSSIVLFGSTVPTVGFKRRIAYGITKSAIEGITKTLAMEFAPNTRVNCIIPGYIKTDLYFKNSIVDESTRTKKILLKRLGEPEEVAKLVLFLSSEDSSYINGESIGINGGFNYDYDYE